MIYNFNKIRAHLSFDKPGDIYVVHILLRMKDIKDKPEYEGMQSHEETQRLIKTYYIDSLEYFDKKLPAMKELADANGARVYIMMTRKNRIVINRILAKKIIDEIDNAEIRYDHLIRSAVCGCHISDRKYWLIDLDNDMTIVDENGVVRTAYTPLEFHDKVLIPVVNEVKKLVEEAKGNVDDVFVVPTPNGFHLMTPPFNRSKFKMFEPNRLKADAMTLMYFNNDDNVEEE